MTKSTILNTGIIICKFLNLMNIVFFLIFTGLFVYYQINPLQYDKVYINTNLNTNIIFIYGSENSLNVSANPKAFPINELNNSSLYFIYIKLMLAALLGFLYIKEFQNVIESVKEIKTFQKRNITSFRKIGKYLILTFIILSYSSFSFQTGSTTQGFHFSFELIFIAIIAYIMAEIFKEGNRLSEENELTV